nr:hypothetical protein Iba_chr13dCG10070 [Ipomoea batatas]
MITGKKADEADSKFRLSGDGAWCWRLGFLAISLQRGKEVFKNGDIFLRLELASNALACIMRLSKANSKKSQPLAFSTGGGKPWGGWLLRKRSQIRQILQQTGEPDSKSLVLMDRERRRPWWMDYISRNADAEDDESVGFCRRGIGVG